jgi:hypothetical protein
MSPRRHLLPFAILWIAVLPSALAQTRTLRWGPEADTHIRMGGPEVGSNFGSSGLMEVYQYSDTRAYLSYIRFDLGLLPVDAMIESASLTLTYERGGTRTDMLTRERFAVYGLLDRTGNTPQRWEEHGLTAANVGAEIIAPSNLQLDTSYRVLSFEGINEVITGNGQPGTRAGLGNSPELVRFLEDRLRSPERVVTFIVDIPLHTTDGRGYAFATKENADSSLAPQLEVVFRRIGSGAEPRLGPRRE